MQWYDWLLLTDIIYVYRMYRLLRVVIQCATYGQKYRSRFFFLNESQLI